MQRPQTNDLVKFLQSQHVNSGFVNKLKVAYRPYICPFEDILKLVGDDDTVFDIGCGSGQFAILLAEFTQVKRVGGIEIKPELIKNANELMQPYASRVDFNFQVYDGKLMPESIGQYSMITLIDVLHHVPPNLQVNFIETILKKMAPGAQLIIKDIDGGSPLVYFNKLHDIIFAGEIGNELPSAWVTEKLRQLGCLIVSSTRRNMYVYPHYTVLARKQ